MTVYVNSEEYRQYIQTHHPEIQLVDQLLDADTYITGSFKPEQYHHRLKHIVIPFTGHNRIDIPTLKAHGIKLFNTTVHAPFVAERAVQLMFALLGHIVFYHNNMTHGNWSNRNNVHRVPWVSIQKKSIGIYGYGRIGQAIHSYLKPFDIEVYIIDRNKDFPDVNKVKNLTNLVQCSDIVFITAPLSKETEGAFDAQVFSHFQNRYLINVGRGQIIDEKALYNALKENVLKGFASDVWFQYPKQEELLYPSQYPIHTLDNVVMTPHCGGLTENSPQMMMEDVCQTLLQIQANNVEKSLDLDQLK